MKTIIFLTLLTLSSLIGFSQKALTKSEQAELEFITNYNGYVKFCENHKITPKSQTDWILEISNRYDGRLRRDIDKISTSLITSGNYLTKARTQILIGLGCGLMSGAVIYTGSATYTNQLTNTDWRYSANSIQGIEEREFLETKRSIFFIGGGVLALTGFALEISGIINLGKAGIVLNEHEAGVRIKF